MAKSGVTSDTNGNGALDVGDEVDYSYLVSNTGSVTLDPVTINDPQPGLSAVSCPAAPLSPGASTTCTATYPITQADLDAGVVTDTATASGQPPAGPAASSAPSTADVTLAAAPAIALLKSAAVDDQNGDFQIDLGDTVTWSFTVTNNGNVTVHGIAVSDPTAGPVSCAATSLAPGDDTVCTADTPHTIDQADVDAGIVSNTATSSALDPNGTAVPSNSSSTDTPVAQGSGLTATKQAAVTDVDHDGHTDLGDTIAYSVVVHNSGHVTLHSVSITDPLAGTFTCPTAPLAPGQSTTCTATTAYTITQADVDAGQVDNTATAHALDPAGATVDAPSSSVTTPVAATSSLLLVKHAAIADTSGDGHRGVGDTIRWTFTLTNTGTRSLTGLFVDDPTAGVGDLPVDRARARSLDPLHG